MKKVIINSCYGGFGLSDACMEELAARKGHKAYGYEYGENCLCRCRETNSCKTFLLDIDQEAVSYEEAEQHHFDSMFDGDMRTDPVLVSLIEEKGSEWASRWSARLKIVEIPDDVKYIIEEYDGNEWVAEEHRTWK